MTTIPEATVEAAGNTSAIELHVWWIPQVPMEPFIFPVATIETGITIMEALGKYDAFQFEKGVKPDYCNSGGMSWCHPDLTHGEWYDFDPHDEDEVEEVRAALESAREHGVGWRAMESSEPPKDGTPIEVYFDGQVRVVRWFKPWAIWHDTVYTDVDPENDEWFGIGSKLPTHWRPIVLPPAPQDGSGR